MQSLAYSRTSYEPSAPAPSIPSVVVGAAIGMDVLSIVAAALVSTWIYKLNTDIAMAPDALLGAGLVVAIVFSVIARARGLYEPTNLMMIERQLKWATLIWGISLGILLAVGFLIKSSADLSRGAILVFAASGWGMLLVHRVLWSYGLRGALRSGRLPRRRAAILTCGVGGTSTGYVEALERVGFQVVERFSLDLGREPEALGAELDRLCSAVRGSSIDEIVLAIPASCVDRLDAILEGLRPLPLPVRLIPDTALARVVLQPVRHLGSFALVDIQREPLSRLELAFKRALDIVVAGSALVALAPLLGLAMLAVKLDSKGPVLFRQTRRGFNGRDFKILKLRSMSVMEDGAGITQARKSDPRVTRVGYWLRRTSIDELPQLWNVLHGEMSIIGPRPHAVAHDNYYDPLIENYAFRHHVKPGLTGWAQVSGHRGETPEVSMMAARIDHDLWYINNWTPFLDIRILLLTCVRLFAKTAY